MEKSYIENRSVLKHWSEYILIVILNLSSVGNVYAQNQVPPLYQLKYSFDKKVDSFQMVLSENGDKKFTDSSRSNFVTIQQSQGRLKIKTLLEQFTQAKSLDNSEVTLKVRYPEFEIEANIPPGQPVYLRVSKDKPYEYSVGGNPSQMPELLKHLTEDTFSAVVKPSGRIIRIVDTKLDNIWKTAGPGSAIQPWPLFFVEYPDKPIGMGEKWRRNISLDFSNINSPIKVDVVYTLKDVKTINGDQMAKFDMKGNFTQKGLIVPTSYQIAPFSELKSEIKEIDIELKAEFCLNITAGHLEKSELTVDMNACTEVTGRSGQTKETSVPVHWTTEISNYIFKLKTKYRKTE